MVYILESELSLSVYSASSIRWVEQLHKPLARPVPRRVRTACGDDLEMLYNAMEFREKRLFEGKRCLGHAVQTRQSNYTVFTSYSSR